MVKGGYCHYCNETVRKNRSRVKTNCKIRSQKVARGVNKNSEANKAFYRQVWQHWQEKGKLFCAESGKPLGEFDPAKIAHILARGAYPKLAYVFENVVPLLPEYHHQLDHGKCTSLKIWPWIQEKRTELKQKYYGNNTKPLP